MIRSAAWILVLGNFIIGGVCPVSASDLLLRAGAGYEFISQEFFLDSLERSGLDSLEFVTALRTTYLNDFKGHVELGYVPDGGRRVDIRTRYEQTSDFYRAKMLADFRPSVGRSRLDINTELDWRNRHSGQADPGDDYVYGTGASFHGKAELRGDFVAFDSASELSYDYYRVGGSMGFGITFPGFSMLDAGAFLIGRKVPDSSRLDYLSYGIEGAFIGFYSGGDIDMLGQVERRDYDRPGDTADYWRIEGDGRNRTWLGKHWFIFQEPALEIWLYDLPSLINYDFLRGGLKLLGGKQLGYFRLGLGGDFEIQSELESLATATDDYFESGFVAELEYINSARAYWVLESVFGYRSLKDESVFQSSFRFERLSLIGDWRITGPLRLNVLASAEWEWHAVEQENNQLYFFSTTFEYRFR